MVISYLIHMYKVIFSNQQNLISMVQSLTRIVKMIHSGNVINL